MTVDRVLAIIRDAAIIAFVIGAFVVGLVGF